MVELIPNSSTQITRTWKMRQHTPRRVFFKTAKAHAGKQHDKHFGWKTFRVLTVTTDQHRMQSMMEALRRLHVPHSPGAPLFFFTTRDELRASDPLAAEWRDGNSREVRLL